ncbi:MAG: hypothetical protein ACK44M_09595, partial [Chloroflexus sp.]
ATFGSANDHATSYSSPFFLTFPIIIAGLVLKPALVWITFLCNLSGLLIAWRLTGIPLLTNPFESTLQSAAILLLFGTTLSAFVGGHITEQALRETRRLREEASRNAVRFTTLNAELEIEIAERTAALETTLRDREQRVAAQARLLAENEQLLHLVAAARLMGAQVTLAGIRPEVAQILVSRGIKPQEIRTASTLQAALAQR